MNILIVILVLYFCVFTIAGTFSPTDYYQNFKFEKKDIKVNKGKLILFYPGAFILLFSLMFFLNASLLTFLTETLNLFTFSRCSYLYCDYPIRNWVFIGVLIYLVINFIFNVLDKILGLQLLNKLGFIDKKTHEFLECFTIVKKMKYHLIANSLWVTKENIQECNRKVNSGEIKAINYGMLQRDAEFNSHIEDMFENEIYYKKSFEDARFTHNCANYLILSLLVSFLNIVIYTPAYIIYGFFF
tara:strand:- start:717 stop:1445 length:729 start_codon:yes stop_codon:yes gene_type:complete